MNRRTRAMRLPHGQHCESGFSLIEVLVALLVLALALSGMIKVGMENASARSQLQQQTYALWVAGNAIESLRLEPGLPPTGLRNGQSSMGHSIWYWELEVSNTSVESIRRLEVAVYADQARQQAVTHLTSFAGTASE